MVPPGEELLQLDQCCWFHFEQIHSKWEVHSSNLDFINAFEAAKRENHSSVLL
jgi:hypothetical protein